MMTIAEYAATKKIALREVYRMIEEGKIKTVKLAKEYVKRVPVTYIAE